LNQNHVVEMESELWIPFSSGREAEIVYNALRVEVEPARSKVTRVLEVEGPVLHLMLRAEEARSLRVSLNSFLEHLILATETIRLFGPPT